ncbi:MAG: hypothetical protein Fur005_40970 [Roseiflexaceae bacterium]
MNTPTTPPWRSAIAGGLAGASGAISLMIFYVFVLSIGLFWQYAYLRNVPVLGEQADDMVFENLARIPSFLAGWSGIALVLIIVGVGLALIEQQNHMIAPEWQGRIAPTIMLLIAGTVVASAILINTDQSLFGEGTQSESLPTLAERRPAVWNLLFFAIWLALATGGGTWLFWSWWYQRWQRWLGSTLINRAIDQPDPPQVHSDAWFQQRQRQSQTLRVALIAFGVSAVVLIGSSSLYDLVRSQVASGEVWVEPTSPNRGVRLLFKRPEQHLIIENTYGSGSATVRLLDQNQQQLGESVAISWRNTLSFQRANLATDGLPNGSYILNAQLASGTGGRVGYALIESDSLIATIAAILVGLGLGATLASMVLAISIWRGRIEA